MNFPHCNYLNGDILPINTNSIERFARNKFLFEDANPIKT